MNLNIYRYNKYIILLDLEVNQKPNQSNKEFKFKGIYTIGLV